MPEYAINTGRPNVNGADTYVRRAHCATSDVARIKRFKTARAAEDFLRKHRDDVLLFRARIVAAPVAEAPQPDPDAVENVTLTVSLNQARTILAALNRRCDELDYSPRPPHVDALLAETKAAYQSIDRQAFQGAAR